MGNRTDTIIQIRRTNSAISNSSTQNADIYPGELIYSNNTKAIVIGNSDSEDVSTIKNSKAIELAGQDFIGKSIYHTGTSAKPASADGITLCNRDKQGYNPITTANNVYRVSGKQVLSTTVESSLVATESTLNDLSATVNQWNSGATAVSKANQINVKVGEDNLYLVGVAKVTNIATGYKDLEVTAGNSAPYIDGGSKVLYGAAWNDYAEIRETAAKPGMCVIESGDGKLVLATKHCQAPGLIVSNTYGHCLGTPDSEHQAVAVCGRVLAYTNIKNIKVGMPVCVGKDGKLDKMNLIDRILHPERLVGTISEIPTTDVWNNIKIDKRVWINLR